MSLHSYNEIQFFKNMFNLLRGKLEAYLHLNNRNRSNIGMFFTKSVLISLILLVINIPTLFSIALFMFAVYIGSIIGVAIIYCKLIAICIILLYITPIQLQLYIAGFALLVIVIMV